MKGVLLLRQVRQKKAEVHTGSPGVTKDAFGEESQQTRQRAFSVDSTRRDSRLPAFLSAMQKEAA
jgi:hypothetical protein